MTAMHKRTQGFSLVEFMIAITIGLFLVSGLVYLIAETSRWEQLVRAIGGILKPGVE